MANRDHWLSIAALVYAFGLLVHTADHVRRGLDVVTPQVQWAGNLSTAAGVVAIGLVLARHRWAPVVAAVVGLPVALGVAAVHLLPHWSAFSDPFPGARGTGVTGWSWTVVSIEIAGALAMGIVGCAELRRAPRPAALGHLPPPFRGRQEVSKR